MCYHAYYHYKLKLVEVGAFHREWVTVIANFRWKGTEPYELAKKVQLSQIESRACAFQ